MCDLISGLPSIHPRQSHRSQHRTSQSKATRSAFHTLTELVRKPGASLSGFFNTATAVSALADEAHNELETSKSILRLKLQYATSFEDWKAAAAQLDELEGNNVWRSEDISSEYNHALVQTRLDQLEDARRSGDSSLMLFLIRTSLTRHLGNMGSTVLYSHSRIGTKHLIERYISSALSTMSSLLDMTQYGTELDARDVLQQVLKARQSFGRSALLLSGGGTFGMNHIGVLKCLWEHNLLPRIISGASAGSIVCAVLCTSADEEIPAILKEFCYGDLEVFTRQGVDDSVMQHVARFLKSGALFDIANLTRIMKELLGDLTFQEAYNRTRRILNICVSSASVFELPRLLNYVTAPNVIIWSAVAASCSVPLIYSPAGLLAKDSKSGKAIPWNLTPQQWIDGSVENDLPMTRLAEMFNVNHFIVSQVNPHVVPFLTKEEGQFASESSQSDAAVDTGPGWVNLVANLAKDEVMHRMHVLSELGLFSTLLTKTRSVLSQKYSGDITIFPEISYSQFPNILRNPTKDFMLQALLHGERATWPKLSRIQNHCAIELALDEAVQQLRARIAFSPSQVDLRMNRITRPTSRAGSESARSKRTCGSRKNARLRTPSATRTKRRFSSSESDTHRPSISHAPELKQPPPPLRTSSPSHGNLPDDPTGSDTASERGERSPESYDGEQLQQAHTIPEAGSSEKQQFQHLSQPCKPGIDGKPVISSVELGLYRKPAAPTTTVQTHVASPMSPLSQAPSSSGSLHHMAERDGSPRSSRRNRRGSMSTGMRWLKPPGAETL